MTGYSPSAPGLLYLVDSTALVTYNEKTSGSIVCGEAGYTPVRRKRQRAGSCTRVVRPAT
ncbi:MAG: hypothetical protein H0U76_17390 [Ktedonobacteraceae bacterium]|nr:hypothetical protein [Ktedonobacteraceae bacterium]